VIDVLIPYERVMRAYPDRESPWAEIDEVDRDLVDWLEEPGRDPDWDWGFVSNHNNVSEQVFFRFRDHKVAMLFKLTWA